MRIISKFQDYYDGIQGYGADPKLIYNRQPRIISTRSDESRTKEELEEYNKTKVLTDIIKDMPYGWDVGLRCSILFFCGEAHPCYEEIIMDPDYRLSKLYFNIDQLIEYAQSSIIEDRTYFSDRSERFLKDVESKKDRSWGHPLTRQTLNDFQKENETIPDEIHMSFSSPILFLRYGHRNRHLIVNPRLKDTGFVGQVDPWTAYQKLSMFVGNNLVSQMDPNVNIPDKIRAESHGFNDWSFRKHRDENNKKRKKK